MAAPLTGAGTILGTLQYMAPEQVEGKEADARSDLFAFGAVLHEMVSGRRAFEGKSQAGLTAAILEHDPPSVRTLQPLAPEALERLLRKCLGKDPERRWQSAADLRSELEWIAEGGAEAAAASIPAGRLLMPWMIAAACFLVAAVAIGGDLIGRSYASVQGYEAGKKVPYEIVQRLKTIAAERGCADVAVSLSSDECQVQHIIHPTGHVEHPGGKHQGKQSPDDRDLWHGVLDLVWDSGRADAISAIKQVLSLAQSAAGPTREHAQKKSEHKTG